MPAVARLAHREGKHCTVAFRRATGGLRIARPAPRAPRLPRTARGVRAHGRDCGRVAARASPQAIARQASQRRRSRFSGERSSICPGRAGFNRDARVAESRYDFHAASILTLKAQAKGARMDVLIGVLITFLVVILVLYLVNMLPLDGRARQIVRVIVIILGVISLLKYLAVF